MINGMIKTAAITPEIRVADCKYNTENIKKAITAAAEKEVKILVLPELCVTGYTCGDLFYQSKLLSAAEESLLDILKFTTGIDMLVAVGVPLVNNGKIYNCAAIIMNGSLLGVVPKVHLPNYAEFYEKRQFCSAPEKNGDIYVGKKAYPFGRRLLFKCSNISELCIAVEICEDLWAPQPPSTEHAIAGATIILNLSASNETIGKDKYRTELVKGQSARLICGYIYSSAGYGESTTDMVFGGHNLISENGSVLASNKPFDGCTTVITEIDVERLANERRRLSTFPNADTSAYTISTFSYEMLNKTLLTRIIEPRPFVPADTNERDSRCDLILSMQANGLKKRLEHSHAASAVIGISGGLDSCLALLVAVRAIDMLKRPRKDIMAVTMPCFGTTKRTRSNAETLCELLGVTFKSIDISDSVKKHFDDIDHDFNDINVVFENGQARERTQVLMDIANQSNGLVIGTGDLSELALGWATYNGDHMSMYAVNASVPKTLVRHIIKYFSDTCGSSELSAVLLDILDTPVSPELLPADKNGNIAQKTEDIVGPYDLHDFFLYYVMRWGFAPKKVYDIACYAFNGQFDNKTVLKWLKTFYRRFFSQQFKRSCLPDGPKIGSVTLSPRGDWRMPSDAASTIWLEELARLEENNAI